MNPLADRATTLTPSLTLAIDAKAKKLKADGVDNVAGGEEVDGHNRIRPQAQEALVRGGRHKGASVVEPHVVLACRVRVARGLTVGGSVGGGLHAERGVGHGDQVVADGADGELCDALLGRPGALGVWGRARTG